jgi:metal-responsive CopG/Arc/MetJ family transcriptional regulator
MWYNVFEVIIMLKNKERIGTSLPIGLVKQLKDYSEKTMVPISKIIEKAIEEYLKPAK